MRTSVWVAISRDPDPYFLLYGEEMPEDWCNVAEVEHQADALQLTGEERSEFIEAQINQQVNILFSF